MNESAYRDSAAARPPGAYAAATTVKMMREKYDATKLNDLNNRKTNRKRRGGVSLSTIILTLIFLLGLGIMAYPTVSDWWNSYHQSRAIASYSTVVENTSTKEMEHMLVAARAYNSSLLKKELRFAMSEDELTRYNALLDLSGTGVMGYVQIPSLGVQLPIYHGTDESVLQIAVGHLNWSSLPVGGESTHCVLSGHRGLPSARLFTDLDKLVEGDLFTLTVLTQTITYEVDQIRIVLPTEINDLDLISGADLCTLVTCTPYGVNTHRLLVRGHRVENQDTQTVVVTPGGLRIPRYVVIPAVGIPLLFLFLVGMLIYYSFQPARHTEEEVLEQLHSLGGVRSDGKGGGENPKTPLRKLPNETAEEPPGRKENEESNEQDEDDPNDQTKPE